jgi:hypothetical protein
MDSGWRLLLLNEQILVRILRVLNYVEPKGSEDAAEFRHACEQPFRVLMEAFRCEAALAAAWQAVAPESAAARLCAATRILDEAHPSAETDEEQNFYGFHGTFSSHTIQVAELPLSAATLHAYAKQVLRPRSDSACHGELAATQSQGLAAASAFYTRTIDRLALHSDPLTESEFVELYAEVWKLEMWGLYLQIELNQPSRLRLGGDSLVRWLGVACESASPDTPLPPSFHGDRNASLVTELAVGEQDVAGRHVALDDWYTPQFGMTRELRRAARVMCPLRTAESWCRLDSDHTFDCLSGGFSNTAVCWLLILPRQRRVLRFSYRGRTEW